MGKSSEKQKLWRAFAEFIRLRDSPNGFGMCISCNKPVPYPNSTGEWHCGHLYPRSVCYNSLYFSELNCNGQCSACNVFLEGATMDYRRGLIERYGPEVIDEIEKTRAAGQFRKWYPEDYKLLAKEYRAKVKALKKQYGLI